MLPRRIYHVNFGEDGYCTLVDRIGVIIHHPDPELVLETCHPEAWQERAVRGSGEEVIKGEKLLFAATKLDEAATKVQSEWYLVAYYPKWRALAMLQSAITSITAVLLLAGMGVLVSGFLLSENLVRPLDPLVDAANQVANKAWDAINLPPRGPFEIRKLNRSFNAMAGAIREYQAELEGRVEQRTLELKRSEERLSALNHLLNAAFESTREGILVVAADGRIQTMNSQFRVFFGLDDQSYEDVASLERVLAGAGHRMPGLDGFSRSLNSREANGKEVEWHLEEGTERFLQVYQADLVEEKHSNGARLWVFRDLTRARELEMGLQQAQKMEAIGRLAGGVAHDFNNLLAGIIGNLNMIADEEFKGEDSSDNLKSALVAANRATDLVKQLLGFSRKSFLNPVDYDANQLVSEVGSFLKHSIDPQFRIEVEIHHAPCGLHVDASQLNQVVMNLCVNAKDAMVPKGGGTLTLKTELLSLDAGKAAKLGPKAREGEFVAISVRDNGSGIPQKILDRIFEPFFTTKEPGKGTGLGLATSYGIVEQHEGFITCETAEGEGTCFTIHLPRHEEAEVVRLEERKEATRSDDRGDNQTILIVDDDLIVRKVNERFLTKKGYRVITAGDGIEGLARYEENREAIDLVMLDLTMPEMSGAEAFKRLREMREDLPVIIYSGYVVEATQFEAENGSVPNAILTKPFELRDLAVVIHDILRVPPAELAEAA